jgi:hypothetical protein
VLKNGAAGIVRCYFEAMKNHYSETDRSDPVANLEAEVMSKRRRMKKDLLKELALTVAANERAQRRFRIAVLIRLSRIETMVQLIHVAQIGELWRKEPGFEEKLTEGAKKAEEYVCQHGKELLLEMVKYVYGGPEALGVRVGTQRKRSQ